MFHYQLSNLVSTPIIFTAVSARGEQHKITFDCIFLLPFSTLNYSSLQLDGLAAGHAGPFEWLTSIDMIRTAHTSLLFNLWCLKLSKMTLPTEQLHKISEHLTELYHHKLDVWCDGLEDIKLWWFSFLFSQIHNKHIFKKIYCYGTICTIK